ncbi:shikimate dehydrogenase [Neobacillus terrae]|uniref:shikimate dehydrogenase n=1 Tax=Neobacillus terrae TaxID=3034837 RepID=UPI001409F38F|nr:shikimate dehydrogenase [Neobacillus terrae]NHM30394.1 shikimate dehydrogenase [Neobacillus terrae]
MKKLYAVLGDPISQSMSPQMHNDLFAFYGVDAAYHAFQVKTEELSDAIKGLKAIGASGFNVTIPHKSAIIPLLDAVDPLALEIGAVNTVVNQDGRLIGFNTDGPGFLTGIQSEMPDIFGKRILLIGAGGAARAIYFTLAKAGAARVDIYNRTQERAKALIDSSPYSHLSNAVSLQQVQEELPIYDLIVQTTSVGMYPRENEKPLTLENLSETSVVTDIIYNPLETQFLAAAKKKGARIQNGVEMFIYQGAIAFEKWTGVFPDTNRMRKNVLQQLGGTIC